MTANLLALKQVGLQLGRSPRFLLQDISFELQAGERVALLGNQGSGKTLLLQLLNGLKSPSQGQIQWQGQSLSDTSPVTLRQQIAWLPQHPRLLAMTGKEAIAYPLKLQGLNSNQIQQRLDSWLEILNIPLSWLDQRENALSLPAIQAISLIRALAMAPKLLLLDNPWPNALSDPLHATTGPLVASQSNSLPTWENPQNQIDKALRHFTQSGGTMLWTMTERPKQTFKTMNLFQRLLCIHQGQLCKDTIATTAAWQQATSDLLQNSIVPSTQSTSDDWDD